jgi:hypothetical protein
MSNEKQTSDNQQGHAPLAGVRRRLIYGQLKPGDRFIHNGVRYQKVFASQSCVVSDDEPFAKRHTFTYWQMVSVNCG